MALSEQERKILEQLQEQLAADDPRFASRMEEEAQQVHTPSGMRFSRKKITIGALIFVLGLATLLAGVSMQLIIVGIIGFVIMGGGVIYATSKSKGNGSAEANGGPVNATPNKPSGFMQDLEEKWDRRRQEDA